MGFFELYYCFAIPLGSFAILILTLIWLCIREDDGDFDPYLHRLHIRVGAGGKIETSPDGYNWFRQTPAGDYKGDFHRIERYGARFVITGTNGEVQVSHDGRHWKKMVCHPRFYDSMGDAAMAFEKLGVTVKEVADSLERFSGGIRIRDNNKGERP